MSFRINLVDNDSPPAPAPRRIELQRRDGRRVPLAAELETVLQERAPDVADPIAALRGSGKDHALTVRLLRERERDRERETRKALSFSKDHEE